jgi:hypothetical protein
MFRLQKHSHHQADWKNKMEILQLRGMTRQIIQIHCSAKIHK